MKARLGNKLEEEKDRRVREARSWNTPSGSPIRKGLGPAKLASFRVKYITEVLLRIYNRSGKGLFCLVETFALVAIFSYQVRPVRERVRGHQVRASLPEVKQAVLLEIRVILSSGVLLLGWHFGGIAYGLFLVLG